MASDFTVTVTPKLGELASAVGRTAKELHARMTEAVSISALYARTLYRKTTRTWRSQPVFGISTTRLKDSFEAEIGTNDLIYKFVEEGTKAHIIEAVNAPMLVFNTTFVAKTVPGKLSSRRGKSSGPIGVAKRVNHPGTQAREFRVPLLRRSKTRLRKESKLAVQTALAMFGN